MLFILYIVHIVLMKYSNKYEVALKKYLANFMELKELTRIAHKKCDPQRDENGNIIPQKRDANGNLTKFEETKPKTEIWRYH